VDHTPRAPEVHEDGGPTPRQATISQSERHRSGPGGTDGAGIHPIAAVGSDRRRVLFIAPDRKRKTIRLGKVPQKAAEKVKHKVESLLAAKITGDAIDADTARWVADLPDELADKLAAVGLIRARTGGKSATLGGFLEMYIRRRQRSIGDVAWPKPSSTQQYGTS